MAVDNGPVTCSELSVNQVGPFSQTMALGCSISSITMNAGWGSTASTCNLGLVRDTCKHWRNDAYSESLTFNSTILQQPQGNPRSTAFERNDQGQYTFQPDPRRQNQRNIADQQLKEEAYKTNPGNQDSNTVYGDFGKQIWYLNNGVFESLNWLEQDLGFPADPTNDFSRALNNDGATQGFDINGVPVFVRMEDLVFGGMIKSWEQRIGQQGGTYNVTLEGMASLLKGCSLIISNYSGSVATRYNTLLTDIPVATLPSNEPFGDYYNPNSQDSFNGSVRGGNHPNVINLMGLANYVYGFTGAAWQGSKGVSAADIFVILRSVLSPENTVRAESAYFPYGALVGRSLVDRDSGLIPNVKTPVFEGLDFRAFGFMDTKLAVDNRYRPLFALDLSEVPMPPNDLYFTEPSLTITGFLDAISKGGQYDYLVECYPSTNTAYSAVIKIKTVNRSIAVPPNSLRSTVYNADDINNLSYGEEFDTANVRKVILGGPQQRVLQFSTVSKSVYQEARAYDPYSEDAKDAVVPYLTQMSTFAQPRANAYQDITSDVRWYKSYRVGAGIVAQQTTSDQFFQDTNNQPQGVRKKGNYTYNKLNINYPQSDPASPEPDGETDNVNSLGLGFSYPLCSDLISPYYGQDSTGNIRLVYYDRAMCQIQIMTSVMDWRTWCSYSTPTFAQPSEALEDEGDEGEVIGDNDNEKIPFTVSGSQWIITEYEIRAAMSSIEVFLSWLYDDYTKGFQSMTAVYFYNYIGQAFCKSVADKLLKGTTSLVKDLNKADKFGDINSAAKKLLKDADGPDGLTVGAQNDVLTDYRLKLEIQKLQKFIAEDIGQYHSKEYLIRMPQVFSFIDRSGNRVYNYEPAESGWEEEGNPLDDTMVFGGGYATYLANENGTFPPLLGFLANGEYDPQQQVVTDDDITAMPLPEVCPPTPDVDDDQVGGDPDDADESRDPDGGGGANTPPDKDPVGDADESRPDNGNPEKKGLTDGPNDQPSVNIDPRKNGWYNPLDIESLDKDGAIYFNAIGMVNDRNLFYASLGYPVSQNRAPYNGIKEAHQKYARQNTHYRKVYTRAGLRDINPRNKVKQFGFSRMHGGGPCVVITGSSKVDQQAEMSVKFCKVLQKFLIQFKGYQIPRESGFKNDWKHGVTIIGEDGKPAKPEAMLKEVKEARQQRNNFAGGLKSGGGTNTENDNYVFTRGLFAIPVFAAVPVKYNTQNYGPWASVPGTVETEIFNVDNPDFSATLADNMVGGVDVKYDSAAVPWNYGGIEYLDYAKLTEVTESLKAQQSLEKASFSVPGILAADGVPVTIGDFLAGAGPVINSLNASITAQGGFNTNYTLRTYVKKVGFYNNERAKEIAELAKTATEFRNEQAKLQGEILQRPENQAKNTGSSGDTDVKITQSPVLETSPVEAMVGSAAPFIAGNTSLPDIDNFNPSWHLRTSTGGSNTGPEETYQHVSRTTIFKANEFAGKQIKPETYNLTSMMSLDGIISPISFYPSPFGSTFNITKYDRQHCPYCRGTGRYSYKVSQDQGDSIPDFPTFAGTVDITVTKTADCTFCVDSGEKEKERSASAGLSTIRTPPFIIDRGTDSELAGNSITSADDPCQDSKVLINYTTLTPVVMSSSTGEFAVSVNRQAGDLCAHSIRMVGIGWLPPDSDQGQDLFIDNTTNRQKNYSDYDISYQTNQNTPDDFQASNNARFMGLRGPLMLHGWGYDVDGYPVPNASGDIQYGDDGSAITDANGGIVYKNQTQLADGTWTDPFPEQAFAKNWASAPNTWPVGPVDLRWNSQAKVWTVGTRYDDVYVTLENDLKGDTPVRAVLTDAADGNDPLPDGYRKLVFVQDPNGFFSAPRGATVYAKYNTDSGFYNPIFNNTTVTSGVINAESSASVYINNAQYDVGFINPLQVGINIGSAAIFMFIDGNWVVQASSC